MNAAQSDRLARLAVRLAIAVTGGQDQLATEAALKLEAALQASEEGVLAEAEFAVQRVETARGSVVPTAVISEKKVSNSVSLPKPSPLTAEQNAEAFILLQKMPGMELVSPAGLEHLLSGMGYVTFADGTPIVKSGDHGEVMYFIASGAVEAIIEGRVVRTMPAGSYFGEVVLLYGGLRTATCVAAGGPVGAFVLGRDPFLALLRQYPALRDEFEKQHLTREVNRQYPFDQRNLPEVRKKVEEEVVRKFAELKQAREEAKAVAEELTRGLFKQQQGGEEETYWQERAIIGQGAFGKVYSAVDSRSGRMLAVKDINTGRNFSAATMRSIEQESELMQRLDHPNVVKGFGIQMDEGHAYVLMELLPNGSLEGLLQDCGPMSESVARAYTTQMLEGIAYLHAEGVVHRDIKPANLLLGDHGAVKLADFGISKFAAAAAGRTQTLAGTPAYLSPEAIDGRYGVASDIWAVGCTLLQLITGVQPWTECGFESITQLVFHIAAQGRAPQIPPSSPETTQDSNASQPITVVDTECITEDLRDFLEIIFRVDADTRPGSLSLLQHRWITRGALPITPSFFIQSMGEPQDAYGGTFGITGTSGMSTLV